MLPQPTTTYAAVQHLISSNDSHRQRVPNYDASQGHLRAAAQPYPLNMYNPELLAKHCTNLIDGTSQISEQV